MFAASLDVVRRNIMAMFGLIVAGRLVSTNWEQISPTNVVSEITEDTLAEIFNHMDMDKDG